MPRDLVLGNGSLLVAMDRHLFVRDLYWPYVGLYNHLSGRAIRFGIWAGEPGGRGDFAWIDNGWDRDLRYRPHSLVTDCTLRSDRLRLSLSVSDVVDHRADLFARRVVVRSFTDRPREVRLFLSADTVICESDIGDTAYFDPWAGAVIHYKWSNYLLFGGTNPTGEGLHGYACGMKGLEGMEGTWRDCEDGVLTGNPIAQGSVDSAIVVAGTVPPGGEHSAPFDLWLCVGQDRDRVLEMQSALKTETVDQLFDVTERYWRGWVGQGIAAPVPVNAPPETQGPGRYLAELPARVQSLFRRSLLIIRTQTDRRGAILAANDTDIMRGNRAHYSYMWPRDGALVAHALDAAGFGGITRQFFLFCRDILPKDRAALMHKYAPDGSVGSSWHSFLAPDGTPEAPLQEDETALVIWALWHHYERHRDFEFVENLYRTFARPCADFLLAYRDGATGLPLPSWDLWEERRGVHTYTVCAVIAALRAASKLATLAGDGARSDTYAEGAEAMRAAMERHLWSADHGRFARRLHYHADGVAEQDMTQDASLHALHLFEVLPPDNPKVVETMRQINDRLWVKAGIGGMARYEGDYYARVSNDLQHVPGNPWIICTLWRARWLIARAKSIEDMEEPRDLLQWADLTALPSGALPEQIHPYNFTPMTVAPLTWSHAEVVETVYEWIRKRHELSGKSASLA